MALNRPTHLRKRQIASTFADTATVYEQAPGDRSDNGRWVPGAPTARSISVVAEPMSATQEAQVREAGARLYGGFLFYVLDEDIAPIRTGDNATGRDIHHLP